MKKIINWKQATICDIETDGFLEEVTKFHVVGLKLHGTDRVTYLKGDDHKRIKSMLDYHIKKNIPIVGHNFITYDVPVLEKLLGVDLSELIVIDTLQLSWYLNTNHKRHSIEALSKDYKTDLEKYQVAEGEWLNLSWSDAVLRVTGDVLLNEIIWEDFKSRLEDMYSLAKESIDNGEVGGTRVSSDEVIYLDSFIGDSVEDHVERLLTFLMFKADMQRLQELTGWFVDQPYLLESISKLEELVGEAAAALEGIMPKVPQYTKRNEPKNKFLKKGGLSVSGTKWQSLVSRYSDGVKDDRGTAEVLLKDGSYHELTGYAEPNINSHQQVKSFLFSHGWIPQTFKYVRDDVAFEAWIQSKPKKGAKHWEWSAWKDAKPEDRAIPQIRVDVDDGKELCESVSELAEEVPEIQYLEEYTVIKHRLDALKGILSRIDSRGYVQASCHGYANTLRLKHRAPIVNLPQAHKKYAAPIRGCLIAQEGYVLVGSDLSSLENRVGHHFMLPHDPEYVATMNAEDYDAHLYTAWAAKMISEQDMVDYKADVLPPFEKKRVALARAKGKTTNYASVYGAGAKTIAEGAGVSLKEGEALHTGYWELNWSVKTIASEQVVVTDKRGGKWLINPINGMLYSVRTEKDYFSTLVQGTGSWIFNMWESLIIEKQKAAWGKATQTAEMHDEIVWCIKNNPKYVEQLTTFILDAIKEVSEKYLLRREMGCDVQSGIRYSDIH